MSQINYEQISEQRPKQERRKPHFVRVMVYDIATDQQIREHPVNFSKMIIDRDEKLKWLLNMILWATMNGKTVEIISEKDWQEDTE